MINYKLLDLASNYYSGIGYDRVESPWLVTKEISDITKPVGASSHIVRKDTETKEKVFVASGEQSFLYLINKGFLPIAGKFHTITPCMRNDAFDSTHTKYFMKLELIDYNTNSILTIDAIDKVVYTMVEQALVFFKSQVPIPKKLTITSISDTEFPAYDILYNDIEIGSYGYRECMFCNWVYGTGLAEPRFSRLVNMNNIRQ